MIKSSVKTAKALPVYHLAIGVFGSKCSPDERWEKFGLADEFRTDQAGHFVASCPTL
jgi:hypothetical protein